ncbi:cell division protein [Altererythrobacter arenosus]|uniref:Cell division protein n=1 Tax=Altererythrobacter arenosus TaxID=3032592 RepID=A0ABY8FTK2_9SPHN|nr:cell division protein [Altererythrobacter sp. CAU 1644]WFL78324.1 cell division protein [Altererythrobacter sp. CAU 1644]
MKKPPLDGRSLARGLVRFGGDRAASLMPQSRMAGPVPWVLAIMIALTVIAAAGGLALGNLAERAWGELSGAVTVQVVEANVQRRAQLTARVGEILSEDPAVQSYRVVPEDELGELLEPWLGTGSAGDAVPIPALIDVQLRRTASEAEVVRLQALLEDEVPRARVDAQSEWLKPVYSALSAMQYLALALVLLLALTSIAAVWLATRSAFSSNRGTIEIVHLLGGTDSQIARVFQRSVGFDAVLGGAAGLALGVGVVLLLGSQFEALDSGMVSGGGLHGIDWVVLAAIPLGGIILSIITARMTVLTRLRRML